MKGLIRKEACMLIIFALFTALPGLNVRQADAFSGTKDDYAKLPAFLETGLKPNLLLLIDNSASMYDQAYVNPTQQNYCYVQDTEDANLNGNLDGGEDINGNGSLDSNYLNTVEYAGYFDVEETSWYKYNTGTGQFELIAATTATEAINDECTTVAATDSEYNSTEMCLTIDETVDPQQVMAFAAKGRLLNWLTSSKFDVEKEILTGGKYDSDNDQMLLETRGCLGKTYVKEVTLRGGKHATFGIRPPTDAEYDADAGEDLNRNGVLDAGEDLDNDGIFEPGPVSNTRIEIYKVTDDGFKFDECQAALDAWLTAKGVGQVSVPTKACLEATGNTLSSSNAAFNHIIQECWYYNEFGNWQPGMSINSMLNACETVYGGNSPIAGPVLPAGVIYPDDSSLASTDICYGNHANGEGNVGRCWETYLAGGTSSTEKVSCVPGDDPASGANPRCNAVSSVWEICKGNYNRSQDNCIGNPGTWVEQTTTVYTDPVLDYVGWTDDNGDGGSSCATTAMQNFCLGQDDESEVIDPSDVAAGTGGDTWAIPGVIMNLAVKAQMNDPLLTMKGRILQTTPPFGLVHEFKYNLRIGAMAFNAGTLTECDNVEFPVDSGRWKATLAECLTDTGQAIHSGSVRDATKLDGGRIIAYIDEGNTDSLVTALNGVNATSWTPTSEAMYNAIGYFTQDATNDLRINPPTSDAATLKGGDFIRDGDDGLTLGPRDRGKWDIGVDYVAGDIVWTQAHDLDYRDLYGVVVSPVPKKLYRAKDTGKSAYPDLCTDCSKIEEDDGVTWMPFDPVEAGCQSNNILLITDGTSTADLHPDLVDFVTVSSNDDGDTAYTWTKQGAVPPQEPDDYECKGWIDAEATPDGVFDDDETIVNKQFGSTLLDDLAAYGHSGPAIYGLPKIGAKSKQEIKTHVVVAGTVKDDYPGGAAAEADYVYECNAKIILNETASNGGTELLESTDPSALKENLRAVFEAVGGEVSSGSAASVISHSRSGDGAIYQAIFYPKQVDAAGKEVDWTGDVHSLWLDANGNIREDCGAVDCTTAGDKILDPTKDYIIEFYTDDASGSARARRFLDADGDGSYNSTDSGCSNPIYITETDCTANSGTWNSDFVEGNILLKDLNYIWSAANWLAEANHNQRTYDSTVMARYIFTMLPDGSGNPVMVEFEPGATGELKTKLGASYASHFNAADDTEAHAIVNYIRGDDQSSTQTFRSRQIDWTADSGTETVKLGDIIHSTPTLVGSPAENYDIVYGDPTYREFRKKYQNRRSVVYAGGNDGGLHAFNGGYYDRHNKEFLKAPPAATALAEYDLGAELWMYVPKNLFPHLRWLTETDYDNDSHNYYVDGKPYVFDAKIFSYDANDSDDVHPGGWGTVLVAGMRFGGGKITVGGDTMRSSYVILDITNPEVPPVVLAEYTDDDLGYTTGSPTAIPMLRCDKNTLGGILDCGTANWPMDWYLAFGSGPRDSAAGKTGAQAGMLGLSDQTGKVYVLKLGGVGTKKTGTPDTLASIGSGQKKTIGADPTWVTLPSLAASFLPGECSDSTKTNETTCLAAGEGWTPLANSFFGDFIAVDYDLNFQTETLYFGSVYDATSGDHKDHKGALHRLVIDNNEDPANWKVNMFYDVQSPVTAAPSVATDGERAWVYFGTGRLFSAKEDKKITSTVPPTQFLGLKERYDDFAPDDGLMRLDLPNGGMLVDVTGVSVKEGTGVLSPTIIKANNLHTSASETLSAGKFDDLKDEINEPDAVADNDDKDLYHGWRIKLAVGERVIGQPAILGDIVTFTSFIPSVDPCEPDGKSYLWAPYFRTGTAYIRSVIGTTAESGGDVLRKIYIGKGLSTTPNIHTGSGDGTKAFVQSSTGAIISIEQTNPGVVKSGMRSWRELSN